MALLHFKRVLIDASWPLTIAARGAITGATVAWRRRGQLFVTVVAKLSLTYGRSGLMQLATPTPIGDESAVGLNELAPSLPRCDVVLVAAPSSPEVRIAIRRNGVSLLHRRVADHEIGSLAAIGKAMGRPSGVLVLPADRGFEDYQVAPPAQRIEYLQGDESLTLEGVDAEHACIEIRFPRLRPRVRLVIAGESKDVHFHLDSVGIDARARRCTLLFRGCTQIAEEAALVGARAELVVDPFTASTTPTTATPLGDLHATIPLQRDAALSPSPAVEPPFGKTIVVTGHAAKRALPFDTGSPAAPVAAPGDVMLTETIGVGKNVLTRTLPFDSNAPPSPSQAPEAEENMPLSGETVAVTGATAPPAAFATPFDRSPFEQAPRNASEAFPHAEPEQAEPEQAEQAATEQAATEQAATEQAAAEAERRRQDAAAKFAVEQAQAEARERAKAAEVAERRRARAVSLKSDLYGFKGRKKS